MNGAYDQLYHKFKTGKAFSVHDLAKQTGYNVSYIRVVVSRLKNKKWMKKSKMKHLNLVYKLDSKDCQRKWQIK